MKNIDNKVKEKSIKPIKIKYKGEIIKLDPKRTGIAVFGLTATLVIAGFSAYKTHENVKEIVSDKSYVFEYEKKLGQELKSENDINRNGYNIINHTGVFEDIKEYDDPYLSDADDELIAIKSYASVVGDDSKSALEIYRLIGQQEGKEITSLEDYVKDRGFNSVEDYEDYVYNTVLETRSGR